MKHKVRLCKTLRGIFHFRFHFAFYQSLYFCSTKYMDSLTLTMFRMGFFGAAHGWGWGQKGPLSLKSVTHILQWWNLAQLYLTQRRSKKYMNHVTHPLSSADISIFSPEISKFCYIKKYRYRLHFGTQFLIFFNFY